MNICYFVNQYPKVSHTFIRREILALETLGASVTRVAARNNPDELIDPTDLKELEKTQCIASENKSRLITSGLAMLLLSPLKFFKGFSHAMSLGFYDNCRFIPNLIYLLEACTLLNICKKEAVQHVHAHFGTNSTSVVMLCRILGGPKYSFTVHGPEEFDKSIQISLSNKILHADFVVAITSYCRSQLFRWSSFQNWDKIKEVHCTIDDELTESPRTTIRTSNSFVTIGRLCEQKGQMLLLQAAKQLKQNGTTIKLNIIGDGELRPKIEEFIAEADLSEDVNLLGWQSTQQIIETLDQSSALLLPSFAEGLPVVIMESYARSKPVLSTYIAGIPELVDEKSGWLVPAGNVEQLANAIKTITQTSTYRLDALGNEGFKKVMAEHSSLTEAKKLLGHISKNTE